MDKLSKQIKALKEDNQKVLDAEIEAVKLRHRISEELPDVGIDWHIHISDLFGAVASVEIKHDFFSWSKQRPNFRTVLKASQALPPEPLVKVKNACLSFRPLEHVESLPESRKQHWREETEIVPFLVEFDCFQHDTVRFFWYARIEKVGLVRVGITLHNSPGKPGLGRLYAEYDGRRVDRMVFKPSPDTARIFDSEGCPVAERQPPIKWASMSTEYPDRYSLYFLDLSPDSRPKISNLLRPFM